MTTDYACEFQQKTVQPDILAHRRGIEKRQYSHAVVVRRKFEQQDVQHSAVAFDKQHAEAVKPVRFEKGKRNGNEHCLQEF